MFIVVEVFFFFQFSDVMCRGVKTHTPSPHSPTATTFPRCAAASSLSPEKYCDSPRCSNSLQRVGWQPTVQKKSSSSWEGREDVVSRTETERKTTGIAMKPLPLVSASFSASLLSSRLPPVIRNCTEPRSYLQVPLTTSYIVIQGKFKKEKKGQFFTYLDCGSPSPHQL